MLKMTQIILVTLILSAFNCEVLSQIIRPPLGLLNGLPEIIESPRQYIQQFPESPRQFIQQFPESPRQYIQQFPESPRPYIQQFPESPRQFIQQFPESPRQYIQQFPESPLIEYITQPIEQYNNIPFSSLPVNAPKYPGNTNYRRNIPNFSINVPNVPSTTLITDCSPSVCKNLANTIQLMVVSNLLENQQGGDEIAIQLAAPILRDILSAPVRYGAPNTIPNLRSSRVSHNLNGLVNTSLISSSLSSPELISPRIAAVSPKVVPSNIGVAPNGQIDRGLLTSLLQILGGGVQYN